jgi:hypothetical protein
VIGPHASAQMNTGWPVAARLMTLTRPLRKGRAVISQRCWRAFSLVMTRSLIVVMLEVTELVPVTMVLVAGSVVRMGGGGGR